MSAAKNLQLLNQEKLSGQNSKPVDHLASYFYKISNHQELFKIGKGFLQEVQKGVKNFAFTSTGYKNSQQKSILGICCFFDHNTDYKIAIVSDSIMQGVFSELAGSATNEIHVISNSDDSIRYKSFHNHFDFIDYAEIMKFYDDQSFTKKFEVEMKKMLDKYDVVFWDIPEIDDLKKSPHFHYRVSHFYESMTMIVGQSTTSGKQVESIKNFFGNYNINLNGVLFESAFNTTESKPQRKKILGLF